MSVSRRASAIALLAIVLICQGLTLRYNLKIGYAPDEGNHVLMVEHHSHSLAPSYFEEWEYGAWRGHAYYLFSPVPYFAYVPLHWAQERWGEPGARMHITRLGGSVFALAQVLATWLIAKRLLGRTWPSLVATLALNLLPQLRVLHAYVNADAFTILLGTLAFYQMLRLRSAPAIDLRESVLVGLILAGIAHGKPSAYPVAGALLVFFLWRVLVLRTTARQMFRQVGLACCLPLLLAGPFHAHVYRELGSGEVLATATHSDLMGSTFSGIVNVPRPGRAALLRHRIGELRSVWLTTWGWIVKHTQLPNWFLYGLAGLSALGLIGAALGLRANSWRLAGEFPVLWLALAVCLATHAVLAWQWPLGIQGRLLLPSAVSVLLLLIVGLARLLRAVFSSTGDVAVLYAAGVWSVALAAGHVLLLQDL